MLPDMRHKIASDKNLSIISPQVNVVNVDNKNIFRKMFKRVIKLCIGDSFCYRSPMISGIFLWA